MTGNPMCILGLLLIWTSPPTVTPDPKQIKAGIDLLEESEDGSPDGKGAPDGDEPKIGFHAKMK